MMLKSRSIPVLEAVVATLADVEREIVTWRQLLGDHPLVRWWWLRFLIEGEESWLVNHNNIIPKCILDWNSSARCGRLGGS